MRPHLADNRSGKTQVKPVQPKVLRELDARFGRVHSETPVNRAALPPTTQPIRNQVEPTVIGSGTESDIPL
jgi:hypothetical protein